MTFSPRLKPPAGTRCGYAPGCARLAEDGRWTCREHAARIDRLGKQHRLKRRNQDPQRRATHGR